MATRNGLVHGYGALGTELRNEGYTYEYSQNIDTQKYRQPMTSTTNDATAKDSRSDWWMRLLFSLCALVGVVVLSGSFRSGDTNGSFQTDKRITGSGINQFAFIVVGGGPSGILVATKIARKLQREGSLDQVLLLESGAASQSSVLTTLQNPDIATSGDLSWDAKALKLNKYDIPLMWSGVASNLGREDQLSENSCSLHHWPVPQTLIARGLGGCGLINAMIYVRSIPEDFEKWNMTSWTFETALAHYKDLETYVDLWDHPKYWEGEDEGDMSWRGRNGPVTTSPAGPVIDAIAPVFVESMLAAGWPLAKRGFNAPNSSTRVGAGYYEFNVRNGVRDSIAEAFLGGWNSDRQPPGNLVIRTKATVTKVITGQRKGFTKALGVEYIATDSGSTFHAMLCDEQGEIIMAAGAIMTPQLLFNSGISDGGDVVDLPGVGKNLQDHPVVAMSWEIAPQLAEQASSIYTVASDLDDYFLSVESLQNLLRDPVTNVTFDKRKEWANNLGTFATPGFSAGGFLTSPLAVNGVPDIQLTVFPRLIEPHVTLLERKIAQDKGIPFDGGRMTEGAMLVTVALLQPEARYEVSPSTESMDLDLELDNADVHTEGGSHSKYQLPSITLPADTSEYLTDLDVERLAWGMDEVRNIMNHAPLNKLTGEELIPGAQVTGYTLEQHIRLHHLPNSHWVGSAKMGRADDPMAVVDDRLHVRGISGLRIVDASVMPHIPNGNTHSTICVIASMAADIIFEDRTQNSIKKRTRMSRRWFNHA